MNNKKAVWILIIVVVGIPFAINEAYKHSGFYVTMWGASDMLLYCGAIISAIIGIVGVYLTVYISTQNYRDDARNRILPYIGINVIDNRQPDPFLEGFGAEDYSTMNNDRIIEDSLTGQARNHLFFIIDGKSRIRVTESLPDTEAKKLRETEVIWRRATDGKMYLRDAACVSMPFTIENIGNGAAKNLRMSFSRPGSKPFFKTEIILKQSERFYIHIFSEQEFEDIKGNYVFSIYYEDISGNQYEQLYPVEIVEENNNKYKRIDTSGKQRLNGRAK